MGQPIITYLPGSWDLLHAGHTRIIRAARELGDFLYVGVSTDRLIKEYKHTSPIIPYKYRVEVLKELKLVDYIIKQDTFFDIEQLRPYNISQIVLGSDWKGKSFPSLDACCKALDCDVEYIAYTRALSSSKIKEKIIKNAIPIIRSQTKRS